MPPSKNREHYCCEYKKTKKYLKTSKHLQTRKTVHRTYRIRSIYGEKNTPYAVHIHTSEAMVTPGASNTT